MMQQILLHILLCGMLALATALPATSAQPEALANVQPNASTWSHPLPHEPTLDEMIGQMLLVGFRGAYLYEGDPVVRDIENYYLGGVVLFNRDMVLGAGPRNIESPRQLALLTDQLQERAANVPHCPPLLIAVDQEGGKVQRLRAENGFRETGSAARLAENPDDALPTLSAALLIGQQLANHGINLDFAPVLDLNVNPDNPAIGALGRSFSANPACVVRHGKAFMDMLHEEQVLSCVKHFPGHGSSTSDSHLGLPDVSATWTETELKPFAAIISSGRADMVMTAHLFNKHWDPRHPASLSRRVVTDMLRGRLGFAGVVVTDDLNMRAITDAYGLDEAIFLAIDAGSDILLFGNNLVFDPDIVPKAHGIIKEFVAQGRITEKRIRTSYRRIMALKRTSFE